jgi:hypothetical protein
MIRLHPTRLLLSAIAAASLASAAYAAERPTRDTGVACARADNTYCRFADAIYPGGKPVPHPDDLGSPA